MKFTAAFCILATGASAFGLQTPAKAAVRAAAKAPFLPAKQANKIPMVQPIDIDGVSFPCLCQVNNGGLGIGRHRGSMCMCV